jgi:uncharacterized phage-associated protein
MSLSFSHKKATQALNFLALQENGMIGKVKALKLVFFADRYHLRKYGRPVFGDEYLAMNYGPVASGVKDLAGQSDFLGSHEKGYSRRYLQPDEQKHSVASLAPVDETVFSTSDLEALRFAWGRFGHLDGFSLARLTHHYPEWKRHEEALSSEDISRVPMAYDDFLDEPEAGCDPCHPLTDEERADRREALRELQQIEDLWS